MVYWRALRSFAKNVHYVDKESSSQKKLQFEMTMTARNAVQNSYSIRSRCKKAETVCNFSEALLLLFEARCSSFLFLWLCIISAEGSE